MKLAMLAPLFVLALTAAPSDRVQRLELDHQPFLEEFGAADGSVRLVVVLSPT